MGPVESFVDDLKPNRVLYGVRAALLQRSLEIQPVFSPIRMLRRLLSLSVVVVFAALSASVGFFFLSFINNFLVFLFFSGGAVRPPVLAPVWVPLVDILTNAEKDPKIKAFFVFALG